MRSILNNLILLFLVPSAFAGNEVGNGGNAVVCGTHAQLLDLYEAKVLRNWDVDDKILKVDDILAIARSRLDALKVFDPKSVTVYAANLARLQRDLYYENEIRLTPIDDSDHPFLPKDPECTVKQLAILRKKPLPGEKRVLINNTIWKLMPPIQQAGLMLHESIYERLALLGETDSAKARYLVSYLMSAKVRTDKPTDYWKLIKDLKLPIYR